MAGFQTVVNTQPAIGVAGDFASANPRFNVIAGAAALVCAAEGVTVGRFAWADYERVDSEGGPATVRNTGIGPVTGFVARQQQGLITQYLQSASMVVPGGQPITLYSGGDFLVVNDGSNAVQIGMKAYARVADGRVRFGAAGAPSVGGSATGTITAGAGSFVGSIKGNVLTVTAVNSGVVVVGGALSGGAIAAGTGVLKQLSGAPGGVGTYRVNIQQNVNSLTITEAYGIFTAVSALTGSFGVGDVLSGTNVAAGTYISQPLTGTGGLGTYVVVGDTDATSTTISATGDVETKWYAMSPGMVGEIVKISDHALG